MEETKYFDQVVEDAIKDLKDLKVAYVFNDEQVNSLKMTIEEKDILKKIEDKWLESNKKKGITEKVNLSLSIKNDEGIYFIRILNTI